MVELEGKNEEKIEQADEAPFGDEELRQLYAESFKEIKEGNVVKGTILSIGKEEVLVDIGYKSEGLVPAYEFRDISEYKEGDAIDVYLESKEDQDGMVVLSKVKADKIQNWERTIAICEEGKLIKGKVYKKVKGGLMVDIGMDAFLPASQIDIKPPRNLDDYIGQTYEFKIVKINTERKNIVLSRRSLLEEARKKDRERFLAEVKEGNIVEGVVKNITDFGAFIDLCGIDGLLHITDMTWGRISHPSEMLAIGDVVEVMILNFDREKERVSLGLKQKTPNPWLNIEEKYPVGTKAKGTVVNIMPYGAFVELEKGVEGLIHISELSWTRRINHPSEVLAIGDVVEAMVLNIEKDEKKISLGIKQTEFNPWTVVDEKYSVGIKITGKIRNITSYGAFIELEEGIDGLIHISDISWTRKINHPSEVLKKGEMVDAVVISLDKENKKIALGIKQLSPDPWKTIDQKYPVGTLVKGKVSKVATFGAFVALEDGIEGLIHVSQLADEPVQNIEKIVKEGDTVKAVVVKVEAQERKIALSIKEYLRHEESQRLQEYTEHKEKQKQEDQEKDDTSPEEAHQEKTDAPEQSAEEQGTDTEKPATEEKTVAPESEEAEENPEKEETAQ